MKKDNQVGDWRSILKGSEIGIPYGLDQGKGVVVLVVPYSDEPEWQTDRALCSLLRRFQYFSFEEFSDKLLTSPDHWVTKIVQHLSQKIRINDSISGGDDRYTYILDLIAGLKEKHPYALNDEVLHDVRDLVLDIVEKYHEEPVPACGGRSLGPEDSGLIASQPIQVLVIENQSMVIQTLVRRLKSLGHKYTIAGNQDEAVSILTQYSFDYILLDLNIPVDSSDISLDSDAGFNLLGRIRQVYESRHLPVIVLSSGNSSIDCAVEAMKKGANDFVEDVFVSSNLEKKIQAVLNAREGEAVLCLQQIPLNRGFKNFYAEIVVYPGKPDKQVFHRLGKTMLRFFYLVFNTRLQDRNWVKADTLITELNHDNSENHYWFSKRIHRIKNWLRRNNLGQYFEFHESSKGIEDIRVRTTLSRSQLSLDLPNYAKAKKETKV